MALLITDTPCTACRAGPSMKWLGVCLSYHLTTAAARGMLDAERCVGRRY